MNIVFLDADTIGSDIDLSSFEKLGNVTIYGFSTPDEMRGRITDADVIILNKMQANAYTLEKAARLKLICVTATGTNNLDKDYLKQRDIAWRNVAGYSTECVAQHTFAMLFYLLEKLPYYDNYVKSEAYVNNTTFTHFANIFHEINGMTWGIIGLGAIGQRVAQIASLFGCRVIYYSTSGSHNHEQYKRVSFEELLSQSDIVSVHAPLTDHTEGLLNRAAFQQMKKNAIFLNLGRGAIVVEQESSVRQLNELLHGCSSYIIGRMGIPCRQRGVSLISVAMDAPADVISSLSGKLGRISGVSAKVAYSKLPEH